MGSWIGYDTHTLSLSFSISFLLLRLFLLCLCLSFDSFIMINYLHARNNKRILLSISRYLPEDNSVHALARRGKGLQQNGKELSYLLCNSGISNSCGKQLGKATRGKEGSTIDQSGCQIPHALKTLNSEVMRARMEHKTELIVIAVSWRISTES